MPGSVDGLDQRPDDVAVGPDLERVVVQKYEGLGLELGSIISEHNVRWQH